MSHPAAAGTPRASQHPDPPVSPGIDPDRDGPNAFGPDSPNVPEDDPPGGQSLPEAPPPEPPAIPLDDDAFAPDET